jgi:hypothetical protein
VNRLTVAEWRKRKRPVRHTNLDSWLVSKWFRTLIRFAGWWEGRKPR